MESEIVNTLEFKFTVPTIHSFLCRYLKAAHADRTMVQLACYLTERSLQEYTLLRFLPSTIAAASVLIARKTLKRHPWSPTLVSHNDIPLLNIKYTLYLIHSPITLGEVHELRRGWPAGMRWWNELNVQLFDQSAASRAQEVFQQQVW